MIIICPLLIAIVGLLMYALSKNAKVAHIGDTMFWTGLLAFLLRLGPAIVDLIPKN